MSVIRSLLFLLFVSLPVTGSAAVASDDLPAGTLWYLHADLEQMRNSESGKDIYHWLDGEVLVKINDELGIDINKEANSITAFSESETGTVIVIDGPVSETTQQKLLALAVLKGALTELEYKGKAYYFVNDGEDDEDDNEESEDEHHGKHRSRDALQDLEDGVYISFAVEHKLMITGNENQMKDMLESKGKVAGSKSHEGALLVLTADKAFVQAGLKTDEFADDDDDWNSNIIRNTEQAALTIADVDGMVAIEAQLVSTDPKMAESIGGIANGLISLQAFSSELEPEIKSLLANTKVNVTDNVLSISTVIAPDVILSILDD